MASDKDVAIASVLLIFSSLYCNHLLQTGSYEFGLSLPKFNRRPYLSIWLTLSLLKGLVTLLRYAFTEACEMGLDFIHAMMISASFVLFSFELLRCVAPPPEEWEGLILNERAWQLLAFIPMMFYVTNNIPLFWCAVKAVTALCLVLLFMAGLFNSHVLLAAIPVLYPGQVYHCVVCSYIWSSFLNFYFTIISDDQLLPKYFRPKLAAPIDPQYGMMM